LPRAPAAAPTRGAGQSRAVIDAVRPVVDAGRFPVARVVGECVDVEADVICDGHDRLACELRYRRRGEDHWRGVRMRESHNDVWRARFSPTEIGAWEYSVQAWVDPFITWAHDLRARVHAGQDIAVDLQIGAALISDHSETAEKEVAPALAKWALRLTGDASQRERAEAALSDELADLMWRASPRRFAAQSDPLPLWVDRPLALCSAWYEMFPRSAATEPGRHGSLRDAESLLPYVAEMGFDILYLPPIHPIGRTARKGRNNAQHAEAGDVGSPWAIGGPEGGHKSVHPDLGTLEDFDHFVAAAGALGLEVALDIAFQCSPDHPYVREHPEWFRHRPDGTIQYAENPPKKYQDIYPFNFECDDWQALWDELLSVFLFWIDRGVRVFRVDNPHTKPFVFWDWVIAGVRERHPDVLFLSEAFTHPKKMYRLAKGGFSQSYTYFAWRNGPRELREYIEELISPPVCDFMRPNFWPNTPDILTEYLQHGGRPAAMARLVLAATLSSSYGVYGPVYELSDFCARPGAEENLGSEKYEVRHWQRDDPWSLRHFIALVNRIRRENPALHQFRDVSFHNCDNPAHIAYSKRTADGSNTILCVVNTNPYTQQWGYVRLDLAPLGLGPDEPFKLVDLLTGITYEWRGPDNIVGLDPGLAHIFRLARGARSERDFDTWA
jgi:starch synthase (maltosyl-transferring)